MNSYPYKTDQRGFTLLELLVVVAIFGIAMAGIFGVFLSTQRTANTEEQVVDLKQNQRVALESITRDMRWAGFLIRSSDSPIATAGINTLVINTISGSRKVAQIAIDFKTTGTATTADVETNVTAVPSITLKEPIDLAIGDTVRIIRPANASQPLSKILILTAASTSTTLELTGFDTGIVYRQGDVVAQYLGATAADESPNTITYSLVGTDLVRNNNSGAGNQIVASGVSGLTFSYLLDDGTEPADPTTISDLSDIRAVRVTLAGEATTASGIKKRGMTSTIALRNR